MCIRDSCVASSSIDEICDALSALDGGQPPQAFADAVDATLRRFQIAPPGSSAARTHADAIDACFSEPDVDAILSALDRNGDAFCAEAAAAIRRGSPTAATVTLEAVRRARGQALDDVLRTDFRVMTNMVRPGVMSEDCLLYTSPSPRDATLSRMPSSA